MDVERDRRWSRSSAATSTTWSAGTASVLEALRSSPAWPCMTATGAQPADAGHRWVPRWSPAVLSELGRTTAEQVSTTGEPVRLEPMTPFERKIVHDAVAEAGLRSESEGEEPQRCVVVLPA